MTASIRARCRWLRKTITLVLSIDLSVAPAGERIAPISSNRPREQMICSNPRWERAAKALGHGEAADAPAYNGNPQSHTGSKHEKWRWRNNLGPRPLAAPLLMAAVRSAESEVACSQRH